MDDLDVVDQAMNMFGLALHLVEIEGAEEPVSPAKGRMGVDHDVRVADWVVSEINP